MGREQLSLARLVDDSPLASGQIMTIVICALVAVVDGFDTQSIGLVAPTKTSAPDRTLMAIGTFCTSSLRFCAVTTTSCNTSARAGGDSCADKRNDARAPMPIAIM